MVTPDGELNGEVSTEELLPEEVLEEGQGTETGEEGGKPEGKLDKILADNEKMKEELIRRDERLKALEAQVGSPRAAPAPVGSKTPTIDAFLGKVMPNALKSYSKEDVTLEEQFGVVFQTADALMTARMTDQVAPALASIYAKTVDLTVENEFLRLTIEDEEFKEFAPQVRKALKGMTITQKEGENVVYDLYLKAKGSAPRKPKADRPDDEDEGGSIRDQIRDVAAGSGRGSAPARKSSVRLTPEQEKDRSGMEENGMFMPPELYHSQLLARQKTAKEQGNSVPSLLGGY